jgi:hypothetical protein
MLEDWRGAVRFMTFRRLHAPNTACAIIKVGFIDLERRDKLRLQRVQGCKADPSCCPD